MITIPEFEIETQWGLLTLPELDLEEDNADRIFNIIAKEDFADTLNCMKYICHAIKVSGGNPDFIAEALMNKAKSISLGGYITITICGNTDHHPDEMFRIRLAWVEHMKAHLKRALS